MAADLFQHELNYDIRPTYYEFLIVNSVVRVFSYVPSCHLANLILLLGIFCQCHVMSLCFLKCSDIFCSMFDRDYMDIDQSTLLFNTTTGSNCQQIRLVKARLKSGLLRTSWGQTLWFFAVLKGVTYIALTLCYKLMVTWLHCMKKWPMKERKELKE